MADEKSCLAAYNTLLAEKIFPKGDPCYYISPNSKNRKKKIKSDGESSSLCPRLCELEVNDPASHPSMAGKYKYRSKCSDMHASRLFKQEQKSVLKGDLRQRLRWTFGVEKRCRAGVEERKRLKAVARHGGGGSLILIKTDERGEE